MGHNEIRALEGLLSTCPVTSISTGGESVTASCMISCQQME